MLTSSGCSQARAARRGVDQYETCRHILAEQFGVEPLAATKRLYEQIRAGIPIEDLEFTSIDRSADRGHYPYRTRDRIG